MFCSVRGVAWLVAGLLPAMAAGPAHAQAIARQVTLVVPYRPAAAPTRWRA